MSTDYGRIRRVIVTLFSTTRDITTPNFSSAAADIRTTVMTGFQALPQKSPDGTAQNNKSFNQDE